MMNWIEKIAIYYFPLVNIITFMIYGIDKWKAKHHKWRIAEATLLVLAIVGGSIGAWIGIKVFHHKTMHKKFKWGVPAILFIQLAAVVFIYLKMTSCI